MVFQLIHNAEICAKYFENTSEDNLFESLYGSTKDGIIDYRGYGYSYDIIEVKEENKSSCFKISGEGPFKLGVLGNRDGYILSNDKILSIVDLVNQKLTYCSHKEYDIRDFKTLDNCEMIKIDDQGEFLQVLKFDKEEFYTIKASFGWYQADEDGFHHPVYFDKIKKVSNQQVFCLIKDEQGNTFETVHSLANLEWMNQNDILQEIKKLNQK